jgi:hypothetical protein
MGEAEMRKPRHGSIYLRGQIYWIKYRRNGQVFRESSESTDPAIADKLLKLRNGEIVTGKFAGLDPLRVRLADLFQDVVDDYRINQRKSIVQLQSRLDRHLIPAFGQIRASDFTSQHLKRYRAQRMEAGASPTTINRELEIIERAFRLGAECDPPKVARVIHVPMVPGTISGPGFSMTLVISD